MRILAAALAIAAFLTPARAAAKADVFDRVRHRYADSDGVRIHYATLGRGPLIVMIHGFPARATSCSGTPRRSSPRR